MIFASSLGIKRQLKLAIPVEVVACTGEFVITIARAEVSSCTAYMGMLLPKPASQ